jgi:hypothetical protein
MKSVTENTEGSNDFVHRNEGQKYCVDKHDPGNEVIGSDQQNWISLLGPVKRVRGFLPGHKRLFVFPKGLKYGKVQQLQQLNLSAAWLTRGRVFSGSATFPLAAFRHLVILSRSVFYLAISSTLNFRPDPLGTGIPLTTNSGRP